MSGRAGRRRNNKAVSAVFAKGFVIRDYIHVEHATEGALNNHNIVECAEVFFLAAIAGGTCHDRLESNPAVDFVVAVNYPGERGARFVNGYFCEKAQTPEINP